MLLEIRGAHFLIRSAQLVRGNALRIGPGADPGVQASESRHRPGSRLPLLSAGPAVTSVASTRWRYL